MKIFCRTAIPIIVYSDCASYYTSKLTDEFEQRLSISPKFITPTHSAGNGLIERQVQTFKRCLHHIMKKYEKTWNEFIPYIVFSLKEIPNETIGMSSSMLLYGTQIRGICSLMKEKLCGIPDPSNDNQPDNITDSSKYVEELQEKLKIVADIANGTAKQKVSICQTT